jgi:hypothetical protein
MIDSKLIVLSKLSNLLDKICMCSNLRLKKWSLDNLKCTEKNKWLQINKLHSLLKKNMYHMERYTFDNLNWDIMRKKLMGM